jgi:LPXTG-motif cell wall-anchored protein
MHQSTTPSTLKIRKFAGISAVAFGLVLGGLGMSSQVSATNPHTQDDDDESSETQVVDLHNDVADEELSCPDDGLRYWHFVTAPNNGSFSFESITLSVDGSSYHFSGSQIVKNGSQTDNVFVAVPDGKDLDDLSEEGSYAVIAPGDGKVKFVLSHLCAGTPSTTTTTTVAPTTTTTTVEPTTTTVAPTTTTTVAPTTTITVEPTTTTVEPTTTTVEPTTTTTTIVGQQGPTTTAAPTTTDPATTSTLVGSQGPTVPVVASLPTTGNSGSTAMLLLAGLSMLVGLVLTVTSRRAA